MRRTSIIISTSQCRHIYKEVASNITMAKTYSNLLAIFLAFANLISITISSVVSTGNYNEDFHVMWSPSHVETSLDGHMRSLRLDNESGSGFASNDLFMFGEVTMQIKLVPGDSAGTVTAFYLTSHQSKRDEIDFEFLGNVLGKPYILQTNIYTDGFDDREERIKLWFDPTEHFHNYTILWNIYQIVFMVDWVPIRVYKNHADKGVAFPMRQPMSVEATLWDGSSWATNGGKNKVDWSKAPFISSFGHYKLDFCVWNGNPRFCRSGSSTSNMWNLPKFNGLTFAQRRLFRWVRKHHLIYDYCHDPNRFQNHLPRECSLPKY